MAYSALFLALLLSFFTLIAHETGRLVNQDLQQQRSSDADLIASQMLSLSQALGHWRWKNPSATALPGITSLGLPFSVPDNRVQFALSGGRLWVWTDENLTPGVAARIRATIPDSGLVYRLNGGVLQDMTGQTASMSGLLLPPALRGATGTQLIHLN